MDKHTLLLLVLLVLGWTLNPFLKKKAIGNLSSNESLVLNQCLIGLLFTIYFVYLFIGKKCNLTKFSKMNSKQIMYQIMASIVTVMSAIVLIKLLEKSNVSFLIPQIQPLIILLTILIGIFFFKEKITLVQMIGCAFIIIGVVLLNKNKK